MRSRCRLPATIFHGNPVSSSRRNGSGPLTGARSIGSRPRSRNHSPASFCHNLACGAWPSRKIPWSSRDTATRNAASYTRVNRAEPIRRSPAHRLTAGSVMSRRMRRSERLEGASSKVFIRDRVELAQPLLHEPLHRTGLATICKLLD